MDTLLLVLLLEWKVNFSLKVKTTNNTSIIKIWDTMAE